MGLLPPQVYQLIRVTDKKKKKSYGVGLFVTIQCNTCIYSGEVVTSHKSISDGFELYGKTTLMIRNLPSKFR